MEIELQRTIDDATATRYFLYLVYIDLRRLRAPPATGTTPDPLPSPPVRVSSPATVLRTEVTLGRWICF